MSVVRVPGRVVVALTVSAMGTIEPNSVVVVSSTHGDFVRPALEAIQGTVFWPACVGETPVRYRLVVPIHFEYYADYP